MDLIRPAVPEHGVPSSTVVKPFDVSDDVAASLWFLGIRGAVNTLVFEHREEAFVHTVVPAHARAAHRGAHPPASHQSPKLGRRVDAAAVRVPNRVRLNQGRRGGIPESIRDEFGANMVGDRPADDLLRRAVNDSRQVDEALPRVDVGNVTDELHPEAVGSGITFDEVGYGRGRRSDGLSRDPEGPRSQTAAALPSDRNRT